MTLVIKEPLPANCIPFELLTWQPGPTDIKTVFKNGDYERKIHLNIELDPHERDLIKQVRQLQRQAEIPIRRTMEARILRHISHARGDPRKALESIVSTQEWRRTFFTPRMTDRADDMGPYLNKGFAYYCGRDCGFRPMLFVKPTVAFTEGWSLAICEKMFAFCLEFALRYLFLPGKVETVVVVLDVGGCSTWQLRAEELRSVAGMLSKLYVGRLYQMLVVNAPTFVAGLWAVAKNFISDRQQAKTFFCKRMTDVCVDRCAKHQLEVQYGGSIPKLTTFYPFTFAPAPFTEGYDGPPNVRSVPNAHKCVNHITVTGTLAEEGIGVQPLRWSPKGAKILAQANIPFKRKQSWKPPRQTWMTDFPESDMDDDSSHPLEHADSHVLVFSPEQRRDFSRSSMDPTLEQISELGPLGAAKSEIMLSADSTRWASQGGDDNRTHRSASDVHIDELRQTIPNFMSDSAFGNALGSPPGRSTSSLKLAPRSASVSRAHIGAASMCDNEIDEPEEDYYTDGSDSAMSERMVTAEEANAALARLALYEKRFAERNAFFSPFGCCAGARQTPENAKEDLELSLDKMEDISF